MTVGPAPRGRRQLRPLPMAQTGQPAPLALTAPAYAAGLLGWLGAAIALTASAGELADGALAAGGPLLAAHLVGLVFFPFAVAGAVWQLLPVMLRNDPPTARARPLALGLLGAGGPLAVAVATGRDGLAAACAGLLAVGLLLLLAEVLGLVRGAPAGRTLPVSRPPLVLALGHAALAFALGAVVLADGGPEPLGLPYERLLLVHVSLALVGWLTVLISAVGRTLVPMLALAASAPRRSLPVAELALVAGLWTYVGGIAAAAGPVVATGIALMLVGLVPTVRVFSRSARRGRIGLREGPAAHAAAGLAFALQAGVVGAAAALGALDARRGAIAAVLLLGLGWAVGMIVGHLGKLASLSGWGSWPPGPRPSQASLYPRRLWQLEVVLFATAVEVLVTAVLLRSEAGALAGAAALVAAAAVAAVAVGETLRRVAVGRSRSG